ncbi:unnamed protein product [Candidula unifasciata]|uniref:JmjC domain-containing protein n=1 Tax=Candidula unifasciata TaxID=100452 RepID=A0A8S3ZX75_9EUPU|nr:unnamed protein product [Candidula unifasciata]
MEENIESAFQLLSSEMRDLYPCIETLSSTPDPLTFYRKFVSQNRPVVIQNAISHYPALWKWGDKYLREKVGDQLVTVAVTPSGYADAICEDHFVMPEERSMLMSEFLDVIYTPPEQRNTQGVFYIQKQNSNLYSEFSSLMEDVDSDVSWGTEAFGAKPDAVNFWMGDQKAVTSKYFKPNLNFYHKDDYDGLILLNIFIIPESCTCAVYKQNIDGEFVITPTESEDKVSWIAVDPLKPDLDKYPQYASARPLTVTVRAGETLYLPSLWFHHVQQSQACIAVNYWYDMDFDIKWAYYKFLEKLSSGKQSSSVKIAETVVPQ